MPPCSRSSGSIRRSEPFGDVFCGLGDYGQSRGFAWVDDVPIHWATTFDPVTNPHPLAYHYDGGPYLRETYDGVHHIAPTDVPEYNRLVRQRVLHEIVHHPLWYGGILLRRLLAILGDATPASLAVGPASLEVSAEQLEAGRCRRN
jgi:hypothetical protein